jgi:alkylhydroperoxidase family enzyme
LIFAIKPAFKDCPQTPGSRAGEKEGRERAAWRSFNSPDDDERKALALEADTSTLHGRKEVVPAGQRASRRVRQTREQTTAITVVHKVFAMPNLAETAGSG